jgi:hypothetical protein
MAKSWPSYGQAMAKLWPSMGWGAKHGVVPFRFEIMKRKLAFLQYILLQDKNSSKIYFFQ